MCLCGGVHLSLWWVCMSRCMCLHMYVHVLWVRVLKIRVLAIPTHAHTHTHTLHNHRRAHVTQKTHEQTRTYAHARKHMHAALTHVCIGVLPREHMHTPLHTDRHIPAYGQVHTCTCIHADTFTPHTFDRRDTHVHTYTHSLDAYTPTFRHMHTYIP